MEPDDPKAQDLPYDEQLPSLTPEEEAELAQRLANGDPEAKSLVIRRNLRKVVKIAQDHINQGLPLLGLIKAGNDGLLEVVEVFDPNKGLPLSAAADWHIKLHIKRALADQSKNIIDGLSATLIKTRSNGFTPSPS